MRTIGIALFTLCAAVSLPLHAQVVAPSPEAMLALERRWMTAMQQRDARELEQSMAMDFVLAGTNDFSREPLSRSVWLGNTLFR